jgi:hypothetical protein
MNKLRQIRKRRNNMIKLLREPHEKIANEQFLETVLIFQDKDTFQFIHPDAWRSERANYINYSAVMLKKIAPLSVFDKTHYVSIQKI